VATYTPTDGNAFLFYDTKVIILHRRKSYHDIWHDADFHLISKYTDYLTKV